MAAWPSELPPPLLNSFFEALPNNTIRSAMDKGPAKVRRRTSVNTAPLSYTMRLTSAQWEILKTFYVDTLFSGVDPFDYTHPDSEDAITLRFMEPPSRQDVEGVVWSVSVSFEVMP